MTDEKQRERFEKAIGLNPTWHDGSYYDLKIRSAFMGFCAAEAKFEGLVKAGRAVVERWETPSWKDAKPTAGFIYTMRAELDKLEER